MTDGYGEGGGCTTPIDLPADPKGFYIFPQAFMSAQARML